MQSPLEMFLHWAERQPQANFLRQPTDTGIRTWSYAEARDEAGRMATALGALGIQPGDRVALISKNCAHWILADLAIMMGGFISVPLYPTITADTIRQILMHSGSRAIIVGKLDNFASQAAGIPNEVADIHVEAYGTRGTDSWEQLITKYGPLAQPVLPAKDDIMTIMYTSGTTGKPKGVVHTVGNFMQVVGQLDHIGVPKPCHVFSYLPLSHIAERVGIEMSVLYTGGSFSFAHTLQSFGADLAATQPSLFFAVPRIWAKFREKVNEKLPEPKLQRLLRIPIVSTLIKKKIRKSLGLSKAVRIFSGAAPISVELLQWYQRLGIEVLQAIGMTEDCIYGHFNLPGANKLGTVGRPLPGLQSRISAEGELQVKCPGLMKEYYKEPELTAEIFTPDGYLRTGDMGEYDADGFLTITGRVKDQFKTDKGKYIAPAPIELALLANSYLEQVCVVGMGIPQPIVLAVLSAEYTKGIEKHTIEKSLVTLLAEVNKDLQAYEKLEKVVILPDPWTVENGLMTPTMKVKRNELERLHIGKYSTWYNKPGQVVWL